ncbi:hypothetical protein [Pseudophaeobacter arcticus]|uniref:hypothetical protein n=1 Tax=Pseudophaeobacter arcticus TaxID=385492 RepID=UPI001378E43F|nr:hypothetical protein [Pseudophaeobacter arcticus]
MSAVSIGSLPFPLTLSATAGACLALVLVSRAVLKRQWYNLSILRGLLTGRSNIPREMIQALFMGAALQGFVMAASGHLAGRMLLWPALGQPEHAPEYNQALFVGTVALIWNVIFKRLRKKQVR